MVRPLRTAVDCQQSRFAKLHDVSRGQPLSLGEDVLVRCGLSMVSDADPCRSPVTRRDERARPLRTASHGPLIETHPRFPNRVNAGYVQVLDRNSIALRVWERGAGETLSCGTGACAAVVAGISRNLLDSPVKVETRGGTLTVAWAGGDNAVFMKGPAVAVFEGTLEL